MMSIFNTHKHDSQATVVKPLAPDQFDIQAYVDHENHLQNGCRNFWQSESGVLVYRRMRVREVFSYGCKNMEDSLNWQLGGLLESFKYKNDIPNFLEPWYGIGIVASAFGTAYLWPENQAPAIESPFNNSLEALAYQPESVENTLIGQHTLTMVEYFLEKTRGKIPVSLTDSQSPFNVAGNIIDTTNLMVDILAHPDHVQTVLDKISTLAIEFTRKQLELLDDVIVWPGHGFPSSRHFAGMGMSDDNIMMISGEQYLNICADSTQKYGDAFQGTAFHSCGNWSKQLNAVQKISNLRMVDAAFSEETDPNPNQTNQFQKLAGTGIVLNARIVGSVDTITKKVKELWTPGMKLIVTTYCQSPDEQAEAYEQIHRICQR
jgi:hypothetical protein